MRRKDIFLLGFRPQKNEKQQTFFNVCRVLRVTHMEFSLNYSNNVIDFSHLTFDQR